MLPSTKPSIEEPSKLVVKLKDISAPVESRIGFPFVSVTTIPDVSDEKKRLVTGDVPAAMVIVPASLSALESGVVPMGRAASSTENASGLMVIIEGSV